MNIWLFQTGEIIPFSANDRRMRTGHLAFKLAEKGHNITWWTSAFEHQKRRWIDNNKAAIQISSNIQIFFLKGCGYSKNLSYKRYKDHILVAKDFIKKVNNFPKPDVIVAALPEHNLAYNALQFAKTNNIPFILDLRDPWPDFFLDFIKNPILKFFGRIALIKDFKKSRYLLHHSDVLVSMMKSLLEWGQINGKRDHTDNDRVFYLGCHKPSEYRHNDASLEFRQFIEQISDKYNILFLGTLNNYYNPVTIINAAKLINTDEQLKNKINFIIAGSGELFDYLKKEANGISNIYFPGWVDENQISALLKYSKIGIITTQLDGDTFPNKAFTYVSGGLPLLSSSNGELPSIIENEKLGFNFPKNDHIVLKEKILYLFNHPDEESEIKQNVQNAFRNTFDTEVIYEKYVRLIEQLTNKDK